MIEKYYIIDIETGYKTEVTKEIRDEYIRIFESFKPVVTGKYLGVPIIVGTQGGMNCVDYENIFNKPENYTIL